MYSPPYVTNYYMRESEVNTYIDNFSLYLHLFNATLTTLNALLSCVCSRQKDICYVVPWRKGKNYMTRCSNVIFYSPFLSLRQLFLVQSV